MEIIRGDWYKAYPIKVGLKLRARQNFKDEVLNSVTVPLKS